MMSNENAQITMAIDLDMDMDMGKVKVTSARLATDCLTERLTERLTGSGQDSDLMGGWPSAKRIALGSHRTTATAAR